MINFTPITNVLGALLVIVGAFMFTAIPFSLYFESGDAIPLLLSGLITMAVGGFLWWIQFSKETAVGKREGYLIVVLGWLCMVCASTLPFLLSGQIPNITDAFFETMSGMTTTGASIINDIESVPKGILFWRSMTQWIGGMGIIVLTVAILPMLGIGGVELFVAEAPGPTSDKIHPRIRETAKRLWLIYVFLTITLLVILWLAGMTFYDAINHALTTMATGGFSTKNASMAHFDTPVIQYPIILFMFLAGTNYTVLYWALKFKFKKVLKVDEFKVYALLVFILTIGISITVFNLTGGSFEKAFRDSLFQIVSIITTTGFVSADYTAYNETLTMIFFILMFIGANAGSTAGGIKIIRHLVFFKNIFIELKKQIHPRAIIMMKLNGQVVSAKIKTHIFIFLLLFLSSFLFGSVALTITGMDFMSAIGATATSIGNVGPGIGSVGPLNNFSHIPAVAKWILSFIMLLGRLELLTIFVLLTPYFWRLN